MSSSASAKQEGGAGGFTKTGIVLFLVGGLIVVHHFGVRDGFDPSGMLALGFVVLASYAFGQLVERIRLPHITGYLLAGVLLGPSVAGLLPANVQIPPFDEGVLSGAVQGQLSPLVTLAVALIALTAGGELRISILRRGFKAIAGVLAGQATTTMLLVTALVVLIGGLVPAIRLPGLEDLPIPAVLALGAVVASISLATSPAATLAVVNESGARGPVTTLVLASVILKDVIVVILFSVASTAAVQILGVGESVDIGSFLLVHVGGSLVAGMFVGGAISLYLRFVNRELLVFVVGVVFAARFMADALHLDPVLLFIAAGFAVSNFTDRGEHLLEAVETLSLPVYVVFFTLAGAHLDLVIVAQVFPFALALFATRLLSMRIGSAVGAAFGGADEAVRRYAWMGYVSQAGVAISLATIVGARFGEPGRALSSLLLATIAVHELVGPILFKVALGYAGELPKDEEAAEEVVPDPEPAPQSLPAPAGRDKIDEWPAPEEGDLWADLPIVGGTQADTLMLDLRRDLERVTDDIDSGPILRFKAEADSFQRELRREVLRLHRKVSIATQVVAEAEGDVERDEALLGVAEAIRAGLSQLADRVRAVVVARSAKVRHHDETLLPHAASFDDLASAMPDTVDIPWLESTFERRDDDGPRRSAARAWLRFRRAWARMLTSGLAARKVRMRALATYHLGGLAPARLESVGALLVTSEQHLVARCRSIFDTAAHEYGELARKVREEVAPPLLEAPPPTPPAESVAGSGVADSSEISDELDSLPPRPRVSIAPIPEPKARVDMESAPTAPQVVRPPLDLSEELSRIRAELDAEVSLAAVELDRIGRDLGLRSARVAADVYRGIAEDLRIIGTPDLDAGERAPSRTFTGRNAALNTLGAGYRAAREATAASYALLSLELELVELEGRVGDVLREQASELARGVRGRSQRQVDRIREALEETVAQLDVTLATDLSATELAEAIKLDCESLVKLSAEAHRAVEGLRDQLSTEESVAGLLDALVRASQKLTERYTVPAGPIPRAEWKLPPPVETVEIPFREWVVAHVESSLAPRIFGTARSVAAGAEKLALALSELERRVAFNVELAVGELAPLGDEKPSDAAVELVRGLVRGTLTRNMELFASYASETERWVDDMQSGLERTLLEGLGSLRGELVLGQISRVRVQLVKQAAQRRALRRQLSELRAAAAETGARITRRARATIGESRLEALRGVAGLPPEVSSVAPSVAALAAPPPGSRVPIVYRRLFATQALEAGDILTGRAAALEQARGALEDRAGAGLRTAALVGPDGVGKSAFIDAVIRGKRWKSVVKHDLVAPASCADVQEILDLRGDGQLIIVAGLSYLYQLRPGGSAPLQAFVDGVVRDGGRNAFLVRADGLVWAQASGLAPLRDAFPEVVSLPPLDVEGLRAAVLARHSVSGYGLMFSDGERESSAIDSLAVRALASVARPQETFFRALHDASGGLVRDALRLWLASVRDVDETDDLVHLGPVPASPLSILRQLDEEAGLALYQLLRQGWMSAEVLAWLMACEETAAEARLLRLAHQGVVVRVGEHYKVPVHLRGPVMRLLMERGLLRPEARE